MVSAQEIERQLAAIGANFRFWGRGEIRELQHILIPSEQIQFCLNGRYEGGFALLCATDQRILLIDKKPFYLTLEDVRYDMVSEVDFSSRLLDSTVRICTPNKDLRFTSFHGSLLRKMTAYMQNRVMEFRQQHMMQPAQQPSFLPAQYYIQTNDTPKGGVSSFQHRVLNPYIKVPLMMRRRVSRFYPGS
jgi:hypothetical protein